MVQIVAWAKWQVKGLCKADRHFELFVGKRKSNLSPILRELSAKSGVRVGCAISEVGFLMSAREFGLNKRNGV